MTKLASVMIGLDINLFLVFLLTSTSSWSLQKYKRVVSYFYFYFCFYLAAGQVASSHLDLTLGH